MARATTKAKKDGRAVKASVREHYARIARQPDQSCCSKQPSCGCGASGAQAMGQLIGYTPEDLAAIPELANLGLGCGNPVAIASLAPGETVLDLGSGAGIDCFLAAERVGPKGKVIGVDMTPEMLRRARRNAKEGGYRNVVFKRGEIEHLPLPARSVDVVISNCVINLSPDKPRVFKEALRVLRPGGRLMVSDIVLLRRLPQRLLDDAAAYSACISGAALKGAYLRMIRESGFERVKVTGQKAYPVEFLIDDAGTIQTFLEDTGLSAAELKRAGNAVVSVSVIAYRPA
jgi:arsenite methyltransferase